MCQVLYFLWFTCCLTCRKRTECWPLKKRRYGLYCKYFNIPTPTDSGDIGHEICNLRWGLYLVHTFAMILCTFSMISYICRCFIFCAISIIWIFVYTFVNISSYSAHPLWLLYINVNLNFSPCCYITSDIE